MTTKRLRRLLRQFRESFETDLPVRVVRSRGLRTLYGECKRRDTHYLVWINSVHGKTIQADILLHELAHVLTWNDTVYRSHGRQWASAYAALTRWYQAEEEFELCEPSQH